jgi:hypothetical protein
MKSKLQQHEEAQADRLFPGRLLPNTATVIKSGDIVTTSCTVPSCIVLAVRCSDYQPFVVWTASRQERSEKWATATGDYCQTLEEALEVYEKRNASFTSGRTAGLLANI